MQAFQESIKLFAIFRFLGISACRAAVRGHQDSKRLLTGLYMRSQYARSPIPSVSVPVSGEDTLQISTLHYSDLDKPIENRFLKMESADLLALLALFHRCKPRSVFEFGLMHGGSLLHFFLNSDARVSLDSLDRTIENLTPFMQQLVADNSRITLHECDSIEFDPAPYAGQIDFIFIDGGHEYAIVKNDTEKALTMLSPGGTIVWDDYVPGCPGVFDFVNEYAAHNRVRHIKETKLAFWSSKA